MLGQIGTLATRALSSVPLVGGLAAGMVDISMDLARGTTREATELAVYKKDVTGTFGFMIDIVMSDCLATQKITTEEADQTDQTWSIWTI